MGRRNYCRFNILCFTSAAANRARRAQPPRSSHEFGCGECTMCHRKHLYCSIYYLSGFKLLLLLLFSMQPTENTLPLQTFPTVSHHIERQLLLFFTFFPALLCRFSSMGSSAFPVCGFVLSMRSIVPSDHQMNEATVVGSIQHYLVARFHHSHCIATCSRYTEQFTL